MKNKATSGYADELIMGYSTLGVHLSKLYVLVGLLGGILAVCMDDDCNDCIRGRWLEDVPVVEYKIFV